eukprot:1182719-Prorocentrum_minimum.AAC.1
MLRERVKDAYQVRVPRREEHHVEGARQGRLPGRAPVRPIKIPALSTSGLRHRCTKPYLTC